jgi:hypothetical protein
MYSIDKAGSDVAAIACMCFERRNHGRWQPPSWLHGGASLDAAETVYVKDVIPLPVRVATIHGDGARLDGALIENWERIRTRGQAVTPIWLILKSML